MANLDQRLVDWLRIALVAFAACLPLSIALVQPPAYVALILFLIIIFRKGVGCLFRTSLVLPIVIFLAVAIFASFAGVRPGYSLSKLDRFVLLLLVWAIPFAAEQQGSGRGAFLFKCLSGFLVGLGFRAAYDFIRIPTLVAMKIPSIYDAGSMTVPQLYMAGICFAVAMILCRQWSLRYPPVAVSLLFSIAGLVIHFKRGTWISCLIALAIMAILARKWRLLAAGLAAAGLIALIPQVQDRLDRIPGDSSGRLHLWTEVAPALIPSHPWGMGWKAVRHEDLRAISPLVENERNHLHMNLLQITLELGYAGLAAWLLWMGWAVILMWSNQRRHSASQNQLSGLALGSMAAFCGLLANGMVEYNFGDTEIFMLMILLMGFLVALSRVGANEIRAR